MDEAAHLSSLSESLSLSVSELLDPLLLLRRARLGDRGDRELDLALDGGLRDARDALVDMSLVIFCFDVIASRPLRQGLYFQIWRDLIRCCRFT